MNELRRGAERGFADHGWLRSFHTFSFADYHDPEHMGFGPLRVINEDRIRPGTGFGTHGHRDMEIISYVLEGALAHKDSMGTGSTIVPGDVQRMSAGRGVLHSEFNDDQKGVTHFLQIWIEPDEQGIAPGYEQKAFPEAERRGALRLVASRDGRDGSVRIHQDADLYASLLDRDEAVAHTLSARRHAWIQVVRGAVDVNGKSLRAGDGAAASELPALTVTATVDGSEFLLFDLP